MDKSLIKVRHDRSKKDFPGLKLEDDEYVEFAIKRAKICLMMIWGGTAFGLILVLVGFLFVLMGQNMIDAMGLNFLFIILAALLAAALIMGVVASMIYHGNRLFITNKHVIQITMNSLTSNSVNVIDLSSVEDASFRQNSLIEKIFNYGTLRLATVGDETTYTFKYSDVNGEDLKEITKLISDAKKEDKKKAD